MTGMEKRFSEQGLKGRILIFTFGSLTLKNYACLTDKINLPHEKNCYIP
jgi:hypothetical protein